jgi:hypothetical protein
MQRDNLLDIDDGGAMHTHKIVLIETRFDTA